MEGTNTISLLDSIDNIYCEITIKMRDLGIKGLQVQIQILSFARYVILAISLISVSVSSYTSPNLISKILTT